MQGIGFIRLRIRIKPSEKRRLGRPRRRWEDNRMDLKEIGISTKNWVGSAEDRDYWRTLVNAALDLRVAYAMELVSLFYTFSYFNFTF